MKGPKLSVVVVCPFHSSTLGTVIAALTTQSRDSGADVEIISVLGPGCTPGPGDSGAREVRIARAAGIPQLRAEGFARASGEYVAFVSDHHIPQQSWLDAVLRACNSRMEAFGGAVEMGAPPTLTNWSVYLFEYSSVMPPQEAGEAISLAGNNCAFRTATLSHVFGGDHHAQWEFFLAEDLRRRGVPLTSVSGMTVDLVRDFTIGAFLVERFNFSRSFAGTRRERIGRIRCWALLLACPVLPLLFLWRIARAVASKRRRGLRFIACLPLLIAFAFAAALGELVGYALGPGTSETRVF